MQKIDFVKNLQTIIAGLQSELIVNLFNNGFSMPDVRYGYDKVIPILFQSKSNYDQIKNDDRYTSILSSFDTEIIYSEANLADLTKQLIGSQTVSGIVTRANTVELYNFHRTLISTLKLSKETLISDVLNSSFEDSINNGVLVFQILIESEGLSTEKYIKIFATLQELIETISKIYNETEQNPEIILLDSGSDTNLGIKSGIETTKSLFLIFKEMWDFITNFKYYKASQKNKALLESLTIRAEIQKKVDEGVITDEEGKQYSHLIKTRTDDLIGMKVLPKIIVLENKQIENKKLLQEYVGSKMITDGDYDS